VGVAVKEGGKGGVLLCSDLMAWSMWGTRGSVFSLGRERGVRGNTGGGRGVLKL